LFSRSAVTQFAIVLLLLFSPALESGACAADKVEDLSALLASSVEKFKVPGMAAAVVEGGRVTAMGVAGIRCRGSAEKIAIDDLFHIGSDTKSMTATVAAMLVEEGKLQWSSTPADILPKAGLTKIDPAWKRVTLEELLTHRAGVRANPDMFGLLLVRALSESPQKERHDVCQALLRKPPDKEPGKAFLYSNAGFIIAGTMEETAAGKPWEELMQERLFRPLGMTSAGYGPPGLSTPQPAKKSDSKTAKPEGVRQPCWHESNGIPQPPSWAADNLACFGPAGTVHVSLRDWARYAAFHLAGERGELSMVSTAPKPSLSVESFRKLHTPFGGAIAPSGPRYAMGWGVIKDPKTGETYLQHFGSNGFWMAGISLYPARNMAILVATNQGGDQVQKACIELMRTLAQRKPQR